MVIGLSPVGLILYRLGPVAARPDGAGADMSRPLDENVNMLPSVAIDGTQFMNFDFRATPGERF